MDGSATWSKELSKCAAVFSKCLKWLAPCQNAVCACQSMRNGWRAYCWYYLDLLPRPRGTGPHPLPIDHFLMCWRCVWSSSNRNAPHQVWVQTQCASKRNHSICYISTGLGSLLSLIFLLYCRCRDIERLVCEWRHWVNGGMSLAEWACGCWQGSNRRIITVCNGSSKHSALHLLLCGLWVSSTRTLMILTSSKMQHKFP